MNKRSDPSILINIQNLDLRIEEFILNRKKLPEREKIEQLTERIKKSNEDLKNLNQEKNSLNLDQRRINDKVSILSDKIKSEEEKLYSGKITNPKELASINEEVISLKLKMDEKETELLELMEALDEISKNLEKKRMDLSKTSEEIKKNELELARKEKEIDQEISKSKNKRNNLAEHLDTEILKEYENLRREKGGEVVSVLKDGICSCCNMQLPSIKVDSMRDSSIFYHCDFCKRILVLPQNNH
jgi:hypothetical protein